MIEVVTKTAAECEAVLISTRSGKLRQLLVGRKRHAGVVLIAVSACFDLSPHEGNRDLRQHLVVDRASLEVKKKYGFAWWIMPLLSIILAVLDWWMSRHTLDKAWVALTKNKER